MSECPDQKIDAVLSEVKGLRGELRDLNHHITGGRNYERGLLARVDRIEQDRRRSGRLLWATFVAALSALGAVVTRWIGGV